MRRNFFFFFSDGEEGRRDAKPSSRSETRFGAWRAPLNGVGLLFVSLLLLLGYEHLFPIFCYCFRVPNYLFSIPFLFCDQLCCKARRPSFCLACPTDRRSDSLQRREEDYSSPHAYFFNPPICGREKDACTRPSVSHLQREKRKALSSCLSRMIHASHASQPVTMSRRLGW